MFRKHINIMLVVSLVKAKFQLQLQVLEIFQQIVIDVNPIQQM